MAKKTAKLEGMEEVLKNLNDEVRDIKNQTMAGLMAAGYIILRHSSVHIPVEYGNLRASGYVRKALQTEFENVVEIGYTAAYALFVHENIEMVLAGQPRPSGKGVYWGPNGRAKFLELALTEKHSEIIDAIVKRARRKK